MGLIILFVLSLAVVVLMCYRGNGDDWRFLLGMGGAFLAFLSGMAMVVLSLSTAAAPASVGAQYETLKSLPVDLRTATIASDITSFNSSLATHRYWERHWFVGIVVRDLPDNIQQIVIK